MKRIWWFIIWLFDLPHVHLVERLGDVRYEHCEICGKTKLEIISDLEEIKNPSR